MLAIAGGKGGVGKTTTALALAAALPGRPLVVDADRDMPNVHEMAGVGRQPSLDAVVGVDDGIDTAAPRHVRTGASRDTHTATPQDAPDHDCRVVTAPSNDAPRTDRLLSRLEHAEVTADARAILVDCPAGASVDAAAPLCVADGVVLVSTACAPALRDAAKTASMARAVGTDVVGLVLTRTHVRPPGLDSLFDCPLLGTVPPADGGDESGGEPFDDRRIRTRYEAVAGKLADGAAVGGARDESDGRHETRVRRADNVFTG